MPSLFRFVAPLTVFVGLAAAPGCSEPPPPPEPLPPLEELGIPALPEIPLAAGGSSSLKGRVTYKGEPIVAGRLFFYASDGVIPVVAKIEETGAYWADGLPEGEVQVCVLLDPKGELPFPTHKLPALDPGADPAALPPGGPGGEAPVPGTVGPLAQPRPKGRPRGPGEPPPPPQPGPPGPPPGPPPSSLGLPNVSRGGELYPENLPPNMVDELRDFAPPHVRAKLYAELHKKYRQPTIKVRVAAGETVHNIDLR